MRETFFTAFRLEKRLTQDLEKLGRDRPVIEQLQTSATILTKQILECIITMKNTKHKLAISDK